MKKRLFVVLVLGLLMSLSNVLIAQYTISSPDGRIVITVNTDQGLSWSVSYMGKRIILPSSLSMEFDNMLIPQPNFKIKDAIESSADNIIKPVVPNKDSSIPEKYKQLSLVFKSGYTIHFRAYDDGVAYSFETDFKENSVIVVNESSDIFFNPGSTGWYPLETSFMSHNERTFIKTSLDTLNNSHLASLPLLVKSAGVNILLTESGLHDYPGMWMRGAGPDALHSVFPHYPEEEKLFRDRDMRVVKAADFIAETAGKRSYPWRVFVISGDDKGLVESNLPYLLADTCRIADPSWIKPGKVAWDWWNANNIYGVDFRAGLNNETYKYYIDFASENGIEYVILDEGWYKLGNLMAVSPGFDIGELCKYAQSKNVGIILWVVWKTFDDQMDSALKQFSDWGVKGIKVDFMQRDDQKMVQFYSRCAEKAAAYHLLVDFHGAYKPSGLRRVWPNVITREGVKGLEHNKWEKDITPEHDVTLPFTRMVAGPMDYTPGAMVNFTEGEFSPVFARPGSQGTRVHQMAMYVVYESPLQMLADSPSNYMKEPECTGFIANVPTVWDETIVLDGKVGEFIVIARRLGDTWYIGAMGGRESRELMIDTGFLGEGDFNATIFSDGINADRYASDFKKSSQTFKGGEVLKINMAPGGGWVARIGKK